MGEVVALLAFALCATIAVELPLAILLFGVRGRRASLVVALAQVVTNPVVELLCLTLRWSPGLPVSHPAWVAVLLAECAAVVVEALLYRRAAFTRRPWLMSVVLNAVSLSLGLIVSALGS